MMKKKIVLVFGIISLGLTSLAQTEGVSIAATVTPPDASAMLDVQSENKGILIPQVTLTADLTSQAPITGVIAKSLMVFNKGTNVPEGYYYWDGIGAGKWVPLGKTQENEEWKIIGTVGTMANGEPIPVYSTGYSRVDDTNMMPIRKDLSIRKRGDGVIEIKGYVIVGIVGINSNVFSLPSGYSGGERVHGNAFKVYSYDAAGGPTYELTPTFGVCYASGSYGWAGALRIVHPSGSTVPQGIYWIEISFEY